MCRTAVALALCGLCSAAPGLRAQAGESADARDQRLLARAESLDAGRQAAHAAAEARYRIGWLAHVVERHGLAIVVPAAAPDSSVRELADSASELLDEFGAIPQSFRASLVVVWPHADTAPVFSAGQYAGRRRVIILSPIVVLGADYSSERPPRSGSMLVGSVAELGRTAAGAVLRSYAKTLDDQWRAWLPDEYGLRSRTAGGEGRPWSMFAPGSSISGRGCLSGKASSCRLWFGLDDDADPYGSRYGAADLRALYQNMWLHNNHRNGRACLAGSDSACVAFAREIGQPLPVPADGGARRSLVRAVHDLRGAPALAAALADTTGSIGQRLARATGVSEDSLVLEWRRLVLGQGSALQSRAGGKEAVPALLFAGVLLLAAAGSGRWH